MAYMPKLLKDYPTPWFRSMGDEVNASNGVWICKAQKASDLIELANEYASLAAEYDKISAALRDKDEAMGVLFQRLDDHDIDCSDLIP